MNSPEPLHPPLAPADPRRQAPSAARNRGPLLEVLRRVLPREAFVLEVASGSGEHALWFSTALPHLTWQPTEREPAGLPGIEAWRREGGPNLLPPLLLDASSPTWPVPRADVVLCVNMIHIAPWAAAEGLVAGAARVLRPGGVLVLYGPFLEGAASTPGNLAFDADLRARDPAWGVRDLVAVRDVAAAAGLDLVERVAMPASNLVLVFRRSSAASPPAG